MYTTLELFEARLGPVYAEVYGAATPRAIADLDAAQAEIDGWLAKRYAVPLTASGAVALAAEWQLVLASEIAYLATASSKMPEKLADRVKLVRERLAAAAAGDFRLPGAAETAEFGAVSIECDPPQFGRNMGY